LNISDTVLFWTNDCSYNSLKSLIKVAYDFNWREIDFNFPIRGALVKGLIKEATGKQTNSLGASYSVQCLYGKGLIKAHDKAENQDWAGTVIDESIISDLINETDGIEFLNEFAIKYKVPFKLGIESSDEYAFRLVKNLKNKKGLDNMKKSIKQVFKQDNKSIEHQSVQKKIKNTQDFVEFLMDK